MSTASPTEGIPVPLATDADEVVWALQTAATLWNRAERQDAIVWLKRAAEAAIDASAVERGAELARFAVGLERDSMRLSRVDTQIPGPAIPGPPTQIRGGASGPPPSEPANERQSCETCAFWKLFLLHQEARDLPDKPRALDLVHY